MLNRSAVAIALRNSKLVYGTYVNLAAFIRRKNYTQVNSIVLFLGYPRSGSSILGSLLDAHKDISISHELNILKYVEKGFTKKQLMYLIERNSEIVAKKDRVSSGYSGAVSGQFNGRTKTPLLLGDKKAGGTTKLLSHSPELMEMAKKRFGIPLKIVHCVRNPFDMITTQAYGGNEKREDLDAGKIHDAKKFFFEKAETVKQILEEPQKVYTIHHDDLLNNPKEALISLFSWLEVAFSNEYLLACTERLYKKPHKSRHIYNWGKEEIQEVEKRLREFTFFERYTFNS